MRVNGSFKIERFDIDVAKALVDGLQKASASVVEEWLDKAFKPTEVDKAEALRLKVGDEQILYYGGKEGHVDTSHLNEEQTQQFLSVFKAQQLVKSEPSGALAWSLLVVYVLLHLLLQASWHSDATMSDLPMLLFITHVSTVMYVIGAIVLATNSRASSQKKNFWAYALLMAVGFLLTAPSSLLLMPLMKLGSRQRFYDAMNKVE